MSAYGINKQPRGAALVIAMMVMAVLLLAGTTFLTISSTESQIASNEQASVQAFFLAEAGIHKALARLNDPATPLPYTQEPTTTLGGGNFQVTIVTVSGCTATSARHLEATGTVPVRGGQAQAKIEVTADRVSYPYRWAAYSAVTNGIVLADPVMSLDRAEKELWLADDSLVDSFDSGSGSYSAATNSGPGGNIGANGDVNVDGGGEIQGNIKAVESILLGGAVTVDGIQTQNSPTAETFPEVWSPTTPITDLILTGDTTLPAGTSTYRNVSVPDDTNLVVDGGVLTLYVTGSVSLGNNVRLGTHPGTQLRIVTRSDGDDSTYSTFIAGSNFRLYGSLYGRNTDVYLGEDSQVFGSIIARTFYANSRAKIHYDQAMADGAYAPLEKLLATPFRATVIRQLP
jgi:Tfp pilus assembly protein PilX